ncbi:contact-dependent growth inhibition system immunity protein [Rhizobium sp.]
MSSVQVERSINWHMAWPADNGPFPTSMVETICLALQKPIRELDAWELRLLISHDLARDYVVPTALDLLGSEPLLEAGAYRGDLLAECLKLAPGFWTDNTRAFAQFRQLLLKFRTIDKDLNSEIEAFLKLDIKPPSRAKRAKKSKGRRQ